MDIYFFLNDTGSVLTPDFTISSSTFLDKREEFDIQFIISVKLRNQQPAQLNENPRNSHLSKSADKEEPTY